MVTTFDPGRMIWNGYTGAAGWMFRQALEGVLGLRLVAGEVVPPADLAPPAELGPVRVARDLSASPLPGPPDRGRRPQADRAEATDPTGRPTDTTDARIEPMTIISSRMATLRRPSDRPSRGRMACSRPRRRSRPAA